MARGTQFSTLISMLRSELRRSNSVAVGVDDLYTLKQTLVRTQAVLYDGYDWPFLRQVSAPITLSAGQRYYDVPTAFNFDRIEEAVTFFSGQPQRITRGIGFEDYALHNPDNDVRSDPVQKWDIRWDSAKEQIEVWPIPISNNCTMQYRAIRKLRQLVNDEDPADLDDHLIVLFCAAELGAGAGMKDAGAKLQMAQQRLTTLKGNAKATSKASFIGTGGADRSSGGIVVQVR